MGIVLKARDTDLHRIVAVKVLAPELAVNPTARKRFFREAQAAAAFSHDHVVTIHAVEGNGGLGGNGAAKQGKLPYLVMEFIDGQSLQEKLDQQGPLEL
jgi:serine/threonine protein kinase